ncbi:hypothetical protein OSH04_08220 [Alcaligenes sp. A-TC2]|uniref:hypothetical protein n=1 Tax=Alcaligenes nematophilus TaxID=2994643 RepID=UPI00225733D9|nr:hypothetical protein [Alcaligenes nematophilus]MCX5471692.1 hypothetical protein [Alcaligenes nematophilus]
MTRITSAARLTVTGVLSALAALIFPSAQTFANASTTAATQSTAQATSILNRDSLEQAMHTLLQATMARDLETILQFQSPRKIQKIAKAMGKDHAETIAELIRVGRSMDEHQPVQILSGHYDVDTAQFGKTSTGRDYAVLIYNRTFKKDGKTFELSYPTLASVDGKTIFIIPLSEEALLPELIELYPDLASVKIPATKTQK